MKIIIVGCGRVGRQLVENLDNGSNDITMVDREPMAFNKLSYNPRISMVLGTGIDMHILEMAGIRNTDAVLSVAKGDNTNIMVAQIAKYIFNVPKVIARIVDPKMKAFYESEMGINCYCQTEVSASSYTSMLFGGDK